MSTNRNLAESVIANGWRLEQLKQVCLTHSISTDASQRSEADKAVLKRLINYPPTPRGAIAYGAGRIDVNLEKLDLEYRPLVLPPKWQPSSSIQLWESIESTFIYLDIETTGLDPATDRVLMVGLLQGENYRIISNEDEREIIKATFEAIKRTTVIGHNLIAFDLPFLRARSQHHKLTCPYGISNYEQRISASSIYGKPIVFQPITGDLNAIDTLHQVAIYDKAAAVLTSYGLKNATLQLGLRSERRLELSASEIRECWETCNPDRIAEYLKYDLDDTRLLANYLLPVVWMQQLVVPRLRFQDLAVASPAKKAQRIHESLRLPNADADEQLAYDGGAIVCQSPGLHSNLAKIDVSSLYPSLMLRYGLCSRKDPEHKFLGVMAYMVAERLRLKKLAKQGDKVADQQQGALKILINGSYGFFGTGGYPYNDYECSALVTAYGRKILAVMEAVITAQGGVLVESDTDGVMFTAANASEIAAAVQAALPDGIDIELEFEGWHGWIPKAKNYVLLSPQGKISVKGVLRKRDRCLLEREFPIEYLKRHFLGGDAKAYYHQTIDALESGTYPIEQLSVTRKVRAGEKALLALGNEGDRVTFWYGCDRAYRSPQATKTNTLPYWPQHYIEMIDKQLKDMGIATEATLFDLMVS